MITIIQNRKKKPRKKNLFPIRIDKNILLELIGDNVTCNLSYKNELTRQHS